MTKTDRKRKRSGKRPLQDLQPSDAREVKGGAAVLSNLANTRQEMLKAVASNLRG